MENLESKVELNEKTTIPLFNVLVATVVLAGGIFWLSSVALAAFASERRLDKLESAFVEMRDDVRYLRIREEIREKQTK